MLYMERLRVRWGPVVVSIAERDGAWSQLYDVSAGGCIKS